MTLRTRRDDNSPRVQSVVCCSTIHVRPPLEAMITYSRESLRDMAREDLIELILKLAGEVQQWQAEVAALKPPVTWRNSSQPPSRDWKSNRPARESGQRRGAPPGHEKAERPLVEKPDTVIDARVTVCANCVADLRGRGSAGCGQGFEMSFDPHRLCVALSGNAPQGCDSLVRTGRRKKEQYSTQSTGNLADERYSQVWPFEVW